MTFHRICALFALIPALALGQDAGFVAIDRPEYKCPEAPLAERLDGGYWLLPPEREARLSCLMSACAQHRDSLERAIDEQPKASIAVPIVALAVGLLVGAGATVAILRK